jgi:inorganic pyrophosphatase
MGSRESEPLIAVVEIPKGVRNKYEYDPELGAIKFDRLLMSAAPYPADYGYIPDTLGQDGDVLDALVCLSEPTFPGCLIPVRPVGMFRMRDEKGVDDKIICVPLADPNWNRYDELEDLPGAAAAGDRAVLLDLQGPRAQGCRGRRLVLA